MLSKESAAAPPLGQSVAVGALVVAGIVAAAVQSRDTAEREAIVLTSLASRAADEGYYDRAMRVAVHGLPTGESLPWIAPWSLELEAKLSGAAITSRLKAQLNGHEGSVLTAVFNPDALRDLERSERIVA